MQLPSILTRVDNKNVLFLVFTFIVTVVNSLLMITVSWALSATPSGSVLLSNVASAVMFLFIFLSPLVGLAIDKLSKKLVSYAVVFSLMAVLVLKIVANDNLFLLAISLVLISVFRSIFFPFQLALIKEYFEKSFKTVNKNSDITIQLAGLFTSLLLIAVTNQSYLLLSAAIALVTSFIIIYASFEDPEKSKAFTGKHKKKSSYNDFTNLDLLLVYSMRIPFIITMTLVIVLPIYTQNNLALTISEYALLLFIYSLASIGSGYAHKLFIHGNVTKMSLSVISLVYALSLIALPFANSMDYLSICLISVAICETFLRIQGNELLLHTVDRKIFGQVNSKVQMLTYLSRFLLLLTCSFLLGISVEYSIYSLSIFAVLCPALLITSLIRKT